MDRSAFLAERDRQIEGFIGPVGRFVDKLGEPLQGVQLELDPEGLSTSGDFARVDDDGRFRIAGLVEGCSYRINARLPGKRLPLNVTGGVTVSSGERRDLGTFTPKNQYQFRRVVETADAGAVK